MDQGIEVKGLTVRFGNVTALEQVNLTLGKTAFMVCWDEMGRGNPHC